MGSRLGLLTPQDDPDEAMPPLALLIRATENGWGVYLSDGQELIRYRGLASRQRASRWLRRYASALSAARPAGSGNLGHKARSGVCGVVEKSRRR
jgi:hypothetical protein